MSITATRIVRANGVERLRDKVFSAVTEGFSPHSQLINTSADELELLMVQAGGTPDVQILSAYGISRLQQAMDDSLAAGFQPWSELVFLPRAGNYIMMMAKGLPETGDAPPPTVDDLQGVTDVMRTLMKATTPVTTLESIEILSNLRFTPASIYCNTSAFPSDANRRLFLEQIGAAARTPTKDYPGGIKKGESIGDLPGNATAPEIVKTVNTLLAQLRDNLLPS